MAKLKRLTQINQSAFWEQIEVCEKNQQGLYISNDVSHLKASVGAVVKQAEYIGDQIIRFLPQYTLHNKRHNLNVLAIMETLVPNDVMAKLTPLECALCILTAFTHDLGMALPTEEHDKLYNNEHDTPERQAFKRYRDGFGEELRQIERWRNKIETDSARRIELIESSILANFIRDTHANTAANRIRYWLDAIAEEIKSQNLYTYGNFNFKEYLVLINASHNQPARWLRDELCKNDEDDAFFRIIGHSDHIHLAFPSLLLRIANIMDFDASRTPQILFKHIGIDNHISIQEWQKHLAITGFTLDTSSEPRLRYEADCAHPVHEKTIRDFINWIEIEIKNVRAEFDTQKRRLGNQADHYNIHLPNQVEKRIRPKGGQRNPAYIYEDIEFRLDQDEIQQLLLGESLWGNPQLCIRELMQNALDAVHMRDLRLKQQEQGEKPVEPVDILPNTEELHVDLTWGHDEESGQNFITVHDNGVGMTRDIILNCFTRIGKSFYRSPDFERERAALKASGLFATPISHFGIGILSCFMIADRLQVRTHPGGANTDERQPYDITISGPGSLFWLTQGTLKKQGTEITLYLKPNYAIEYNADTFLDDLKEHFGYKEEDENNEDQNDETEENKDPKSLPKPVNPAWITATTVLWPMFPIHIQSPNDTSICLNDTFHTHMLAPIDAQKVFNKAKEWNCPPKALGNPQWAAWTWTDNEGNDATGSRIKLWFPAFEASTENTLPFDPASQKGLCQQNELASFVETQLSTNWRTIVTVKGMFVEDIDICLHNLDLVHSVGTRVWIDLRGSAVPLLTADRNTALEPEDREGWVQTLSSVFERLNQKILQELKSSPFGTIKNMLSELSTHAKYRTSWQQLQTPPTHINFSKTYLLSQTNEFFWLYKNYEQSLALARDLDRYRYRYRYRDLDRYLDRDRDLDRDQEFTKQYPEILSCLNSYFLQESFWPDLSNSFPPLNLFGLKGHIGHAKLTGPSLAQFNLESDGCTVHPPQPPYQNPKAVVQRGYDLVFPLTSIPLGQLHAQCPNWCTDRNIRLLGDAPFTLFLNTEFLSKSADLFQETFKVKHIYALLPKFTLWDKPFNEWTEGDWETCGLSALWDIPTGQVLWSEGAHPVDNMKNVGKPIEELLKLES